MKFRRSDEQQFLEAIEVAEARKKLQEAIDNLDRVLERVEKHLTKVVDENAFGNE